MGDSGITSGITPGSPEDASTPAEDSGSSPEYVAFGLVPVFFLLGLLGVLICHALKKKGYRCTTEAEDAQAAEDELEKDLERAATLYCLWQPTVQFQSDEFVAKQVPKILVSMCMCWMVCVLYENLNDTYSEGNTDTVGQIVHYIMKNEANTDALKAMINDNSIDSEGPVTPTSPMTPTTPGTPVSPGSPRFPGAPAAVATKHTCNHLHTIGGAVTQKNICNRCSQKKWPLIRRNSARKPIDRREVTVLAVGRFRVTKCEPKTGKERRTLLITEPNGTVSVAAPAEDAAPEERRPSQAQEETDAK
ncbi:RELT-like protein 1 isoform X1 [Alosa pseudoharengus]|uniref:RELT-like protein 1 isoform X1 n=1 Tax=Alosa pseudoharengus TaxID=34774 RepID=UPI003F8C030F